MNTTIKKNIFSNIAFKILSERDAWQPIGESFIRKGCSGQVFHFSNQFIIKLFQFNTDMPPIISWWEQEHQALEKLAGRLGSPLTHGYIKFEHEGFTTFVLVREMVEGQTLQALGYPILNEAQCREAGTLLANLHNSGIVTRDCHPDNLLLNNQKELCFIDFGNAHIYSYKSSGFLIRAARDLTKAQFRCAELEPSLSKEMENAYLKTLNINTISYGVWHIMKKIMVMHQAFRTMRRNYIKAKS